MANNAGAKKRIRQTEKRRVHNKYYAKTMRNALSSFRNLTSKKEAEAALPSLVSLIDAVAKRNIIHKNKASNLKSGAAKLAAAL